MTGIRKSTLLHTCLILFGMALALTSMALAFDKSLS